MSDPTKLILAAAQLRRAAAPLWDDFLQQLKAYSDTQRDYCVQAPLEILPVAQGRAQGVAALLTILSGCIEQAEKLERASAQKARSK